MKFHLFFVLGLSAGFDLSILMIYDIKNVMQIMRKLLLSDNVTKPQQPHIGITPWYKSGVYFNLIH